MNESTPARLGVGGRGLRPATSALLAFAADHAAAVDTVYGEVDLAGFEATVVRSQAPDKATYLRRPDLGRRLHPDDRARIGAEVERDRDVHVLVSDGLSARAVNENLADVWPAFAQSCRLHGLSVARPIFVHRGRVALMDEIGALLEARTVMYFIGERPGLASPGSLSAYYCFRPRPGTLEADRMVVSNIHAQGTPPLEAGAHLGAMLRRVLDAGASGLGLDLP